MQQPRAEHQVDRMVPQRNLEHRRRHSSRRRAQCLVPVATFSQHGKRTVHGHHACLEPCQYRQESTRPRRQVERRFESPRPPHATQRPLDHGPLEEVRHPPPRRRIMLLRIILRMIVRLVLQLEVFNHNTHSNVETSKRRNVKTRKTRDAERRNLESSRHRGIFRLFLHSFISTFRRFDVSMFRRFDVLMF